MFEDINILAVLVAAVANMIVGALWYSPVLFGNYWMQLSKIKDVDAKEGQKAMGLMVIPAVIMAFVLAILLNTFNVTEVDQALEMGFLLWLGFVATTNVTNVLFERKPYQSYILHVAYELVSILVMAIILTSWR